MHTASLDTPQLAEQPEKPPTPGSPSPSFGFRLFFKGLGFRGPPLTKSLCTLAPPQKSGRNRRAKQQIPQKPLEPHFFGGGPWDSGGLGWLWVFSGLGLSGLSRRALPSLAGLRADEVGGLERRASEMGSGALKCRPRGIADVRRKVAKVQEGSVPEVENLQVPPSTEALRTWELFYTEGSLHMQDTLAPSTKAARNLSLEV